LFSKLHLEYTGYPGYTGMVHLIFDEREIIVESKLLIKYKGYFYKLLENFIGYDTDDYTFKIPRDYLCFPILLNFYKGYKVKKSMISGIAKSQNYSLDDMYTQLYEDALFYEVPEFIVMVKEIIPRDIIDDFNPMQKEDLINSILELSDKTPEIIIPPTSGELENMKIDELKKIESNIKNYYDIEKFTSIVRFVIIYMLEFILRNLEIENYKKISDWAYKLLSDEVMRELYDLQKYVNSLSSGRNIINIICMIYKAIINLTPIV
jgi:hypothetical protein